MRGACEIWPWCLRIAWLYLVLNLSPWCPRSPLESSHQFWLSDTGLEPYSPNVWEVLRGRSFLKVSVWKSSLALLPLCLHQGQHVTIKQRVRATRSLKISLQKNKKRLVKRKAEKPKQRPTKSKTWHGHRGTLLSQGGLWLIVIWKYASLVEIHCIVLIYSCCCDTLTKSNMEEEFMRLVIPHQSQGRNIRQACLQFHTTLPLSMHLTSQSMNHDFTVGTMGEALASWLTS